MTWTNSIVPTYARRDAVSLPPVENAPEARPVAQGSSVPLPKSLQAPVFTPVRAPLALPPATPTSARTYTDETLAAARASQQLADQMQKELAGTKPEDAPERWTLYNTRRQMADQEWATVEQAMAAELRLAYQSNPANRGNAQSTAMALAARYKSGPTVQAHVDKALNTVLNETALQRDSNIRLYDLHRAASKLAGLLANRDEGKAVPDQDIAAARSDYLAQQKLLLTALEAELGDEVVRLPIVVVMKENDLHGYAARGILGRYQDDAEFATVLQAAVVISKTVPLEYLGPEAQMQMLGRLTPPSLDPSARQLIMSDPRIPPIVDRYVDWATKSVKTAYDQAAGFYISDFYGDLRHNPDKERLLLTGTPPALAASERLVQVTDFNERPYVTPQIAARIINMLRTRYDTDGSNTLGKIIGDLSTRGAHSVELLGKDDVDRKVLIEYPAYDKTIANMSLALESAARGSDIQAMQWDSPEIQQAVQGVAGDIAGILPTASKPLGDNQEQTTPAAATWFDVGFMHAAADGSVTLALEVSRQLRSQPADAFYRGFDGDKQADTTLSQVSDGIEQFQQNTKALFDRANINMAPISSPSVRFGVAMTEQQMRDGVKAITTTKDGKKVVDKMIEDRKRLDLQGSRLLRVGESVQFYRGSLGDLDGYREVDRSRTALLNAPESTNTILLSEPASRRIAVQTARRMLKEEFEHGSRAPTVWGAAAQFVGDFPEFIAETFVLKGRKNTVLAPDMTQGIDPTRIGNLPILVTSVIWGLGGLFQYNAARYFADVHFDDKEVWRKPLLLGLVGGFAVFHLWEAVFAAARMHPSHFKSAATVSDWLKRNTSWLFFQPGTQRAEITKFTATVTPGLVASLAGLMSIAVVWDLSGVVYRAMDGDWLKAGTHGTNFLMDVALLRLQAGEFTKGVLEAQKKEATTWITKQLIRPQNEVKLLEARVLASRVAFLANPFGWIINIAYAATSLINWGVDQNRYIGKLERFDRDFLAGAGVNEPQAQVLDEHGWFSGDGKGDGLVTGYLAMDGNPAKFVEYLNALSPQLLDDFMNATVKLPEHPDLPTTQEDGAFLSLPEDPTKIDVSSYTSIVYNARNDRYEDPVTQTYWSGGVWFYDPGIGNSMGRVPSRQDHLVFYRPKERGLMHADGFMQSLQITSTTGLRNWMLANDVPMPPT